MGESLMARKPTGELLVLREPHGLAAHDTHGLAARATGGEPVLLLGLAACATACMAAP